MLGPPNGIILLSFPDKTKSSQVQCSLFKIDWRISRTKRERVKHDPRYAYTLLSERQKELGCISVLRSSMYEDRLSLRLQVCISWSGIYIGMEQGHKGADLVALTLISGI